MLKLEKLELDSYIGYYYSNGIDDEPGLILIKEKKLMVIKRSKSDRDFGILYYGNKAKAMLLGFIKTNYYPEVYTKIWN